MASSFEALTPKVPRLGKGGAAVQTPHNLLLKRVVDSWQETWVHKGFENDLDGKRTYYCLSSAPLPPVPSPLPFC